MKKLILALFVVANIAAFTACQKDRCPAHGEKQQFEQQDEKRA